jgi:maltose alpha-D-glucosyltransferase/alpha-amylase
MTTGHDAPIVAALASLRGDDLLSFITKQRWFGGKGAAPTRARIGSSIMLPWGEGRFAIARVVVAADSGEATYQVPLAARDSIPDGVPERSVVDTVAGGAATSVYDAVHDPEFRAGLARALASGAVARSDGGHWMIESLATGWLPAAHDFKTIVSSAEQSNTSIVIDDRAILKLFRTLKAGIHPDVEVTGFLTMRAGFTNTPRLLATIHFDDDGQRTTAGMVQEFLPGSSDAWSHALERARPYFTAPVGRDASNAFVVDAARLGTVTRAMHDALASDDDDSAFTPEPITPEDLERWAQRTQQSIRESLALLERQILSRDFPRGRVAEAQALVRRRDHYVGWIDEIVDDVGDAVSEGMRIRIHGDYHLGQVLRTASGDFMIIDFEGEPSKSLEERREKTSPLRDVAGMLRSIAYAAATLAMSIEKMIDPPTRELRAARWERDVRQAFLAGYLGAPGAHEDKPELFPTDDQHVRQLLALFETEKAFYELVYELNNRPSWAWIPMRGIAKLFVTR